MDALDQAEQGMGFGGDEPTSFLRLKEESEPEIVTYETVEVVPATQSETQKGYANPDGNTLEFRFTSPFSGNTRTHRTNRQGLIIGLKNAFTGETDPTDGKPVTRKVEQGETVRIKRTGSEGSTRYQVTILKPEEVEQEIQKRQGSSEQNVSDAQEAGQSDPEPTQQQMQTPSSDEEINIEDIPF